MKIRNGFVSNSSSSSFIIRNKKELDICISNNIKFYKVSDLLSNFKNIYNVNKDMSLEIKKLNKEDLEVPYFIMNNIFLLDSFINNYENLNAVETQYPNCAITEPYDRDEASKRSFNFLIFESDL